MFHIFIVLWVYFPSLQTEVPGPQAQCSPGTAQAHFQPQPPHQDATGPHSPGPMPAHVHSSSSQPAEAPGAVYTGDALTQGHSVKTRRGSCFA